MCHQSVGLIARHAEARGITTLSMTSAWSITRAVNPPRAAFVDFPLGHTTGRPGERDEQLAIISRAVQLLETVEEPSTIVDLGLRWSDDDSWKDLVMRPSVDENGRKRSGDERVERRDSPQWQLDDDRLAYEAATR